MTRKQHLAVEFHKIESIVKLSIFSKFLAEIDILQSTHKLRDFLRLVNHVEYIPRNRVHGAARLTKPTKGQRTKTFVVILDLVRKQVLWRLPS